MSTTVYDQNVEFYVDFGALFSEVPMALVIAARAS
jgi:hypothetical protein